MRALAVCSENCTVNYKGSELEEITGLVMVGVIPDVEVTLLIGDMDSVLEASDELALHGLGSYILPLHTEGLGE